MTCIGLRVVLPMVASWILCLPQKGPSCVQQGRPAGQLLNSVQSVAEAEEAIRLSRVAADLFTESLGIGPADLRA